MLDQMEASRVFLHCARGSEEGKKGLWFFGFQDSALFLAKPELLYFSLRPSVHLFSKRYSSNGFHVPLAAAYSCASLAVLIGD